MALVCCRANGQENSQRLDTYLPLPRRAGWMSFGLEIHIFDLTSAPLTRRWLINPQKRNSNGHLWNHRSSLSSRTTTHKLTSKRPSISQTSCPSWRLNEEIRTPKMLLNLGSRTRHMKPLSSSLTRMECMSIRDLLLKHHQLEATDLLSSPPQPSTAFPKKLASHHQPASQSPVSSA